MKQNHGFTLVELSIVLIFFGLFVSAFLPLFTNYQKQKALTQTRENMNISQEALREFFGLRGRYPCPANPNLSKDDPNYGIEQCRMSIIDPCPAGLVCTNVGTRDANNDGNDDFVIIGAIPSRTLADAMQFTDFYIVNGQDAYNMQLSYAVTELMTDQTFTINSPANVQLGAIAIKDEFNLDLIDPPNSGHYVVVSHGENSRGAFSIQGTSIGECTVNTAGPPAPPPVGNNIGVSGIKIEIENCDRSDGIFVNSLMSLADNDSYFDDMVVFNTVAANSLWIPSPFSPATDRYLYNTNLGDVGVGIDDPTTKLHVNGDIRTETAILADGGYCAPDASDCLDAEALGGTAMTPCPSGQVATGIENNQLVCAPLFSSAISFQCPAGQFVTSFTNTGTRTCAFPP